MISQIEEKFLKLPSVNNFFNKVVSAVANRKSILILLPNQIDEEFVWDEIEGRTVKEELSSDEIALGNYCSQVPVDVVSSVFGFKWDNMMEIRNAYSFVEKANDLPDIIRLSGLKDLPITDQENWIAFIQQWVAASQQVRDKGKLPTAICMIMHLDKSVVKIPTSELYLNIFWWWNFPSLLEIKMLCRSLHVEDQWGAISQWKEYLIPSLSLGDLQLVDFLWNVIDTNPVTLANEMNQYSKQFSWEDGLEENWDEYIEGEIASPLSLYPPKALINLWAKGYVASTLEYGPELGSVYLSHLNRVDDVNHRLWRGQVDLLLPIIDHARLRVCKQLTREKGLKWPYQWEEPYSDEDCKAVRENPLATELGHLNILLQHNSNFQNDNQWRSLISSAHRIRNEIAHYRPVNYFEFKKFIDYMNT